MSCQIKNINEKIEIIKRTKWKFWNLKVQELEGKIQNRGTRVDLCCKKHRDYTV